MIRRLINACGTYSIVSRGADSHAPEREFGFERALRLRVNVGVVQTF